MPDDVLEVTNMCWKESPSARPTAHEVATTLQSIVEAGDT